jgi:hypothetical protein
LVRYLLSLPALDTPSIFIPYRLTRASSTPP